MKIILIQAWATHAQFNFVYLVVAIRLTSKVVLQNVSLYLSPLASLSEHILLLVVCSMLYFSYLELALLPCWRFLVDQPEDSLHRLVMMTRGLSDPLASAYCRLYMAHCAQKLPRSDTGKHFVFKHANIISK